MCLSALGHQTQMAATLQERESLVCEARNLKAAVIGCRWVQSVPHPPSKELKETLYNAAFHDGAHGLHASTGMAIVTTGD